MELNSQTIPYWLVAASMVYTGMIWVISRNIKIRMDTRVFAFTYILEGLVYAFVFYRLNSDVELRGFLSRLMVLLICFSQAMPLTVSYIRSKMRHDG